jgi:fucose 4-O-acetylase-like acetyltransferase
MALKQLKQKSRNQTFQWLETLAIIMVIDDHVGNRIGILSSIFPYDLFFMPMLVFVSGYFFKERSIWGGYNTRYPICFFPT